METAVGRWPSGSSLPSPSVYEPISWETFGAGAPFFMEVPYENEARCRDMLRRYAEEHIELAQLGLFDVLGHIGYARRYMKRQGFDFGLEGLEDVLAEFFRLVIEQGKGIELNTSGLRDGTGCSFPTLPHLRLYRSLGGEIVTLGSDSHRTGDVGAGIEAGAELLREAGFRYFTVYKNRVPEFIRL